MVRKGKIMPDKNESPAGRTMLELHITRIFDAPREALFKAWTDTEQLKEWWGPGDFRWVGCRMKLYPGGLFHYCMRSPEGIDMWGRFLYLEVRSPERLIFINSFSDEDGNPVKHPLMPGWPLEILNVLTFTDSRFGTTMDLYCIPHSASLQECRNFAAGMESVRLGFASTWERLTAFLN
jgi:uncharacterized protein YndB with AHSA1/START domain